MVSTTIITGPVRSGKTTRLARWARERGDVGGVLSPDGPNGRTFVDPATGDTCAMENPGPDEAALVIGRFRFRAAAFEWANERLRAAAASGGGTPLVIDEIGPLELAGGGLHAGLLAALDRPGGELLLVVRTHLVDEVRTKFGLQDAAVTSDIG